MEKGGVERAFQFFCSLLVIKNKTLEGTSEKSNKVIVKHLFLVMIFVKNKKQQQAQNKTKSSAPNTKKSF